jgi:hypothetical protein
MFFFARLNQSENISCNPGFAYTTEPNNISIVGNYHLAWDSPCVDTGDSDEYTDELDIDGDSRIYDGTLVDRGADEVTCTDTSNPNDWIPDGVINMAEFAVFSRAWLSQAGGNDPNWNPACNLDNTGASANVIDLADFKLFCENWLWIACWKTYMQGQQSQQMMMPQTGETEKSIQTIAEAVTMESAVVVPVEPAPLVWGAGIQSDSEIVTVVEEISIEKQILDLQDAIEFLKQIWTEESDIQKEIDADEWQQFMDTVCQNLLDLQMENAQMEQ